MTEPQRARIHLQTVADEPGVERTAVTFDRGGLQLSGLLFTPKNSAPAGAVVVGGAWTTVKEQMAGTYARELARRGFAALAFDFAGWGASEGTPRFVEDPEAKTEDLRAAAAFLRGRFDGLPVYGLGICASAGYVATLAAEGAVERLALVAPWLHNPELAEAVYGGAESVQDLRASAGRPAVTAASAEDASTPMYQAPYYTEPDRGLVPEYDNRFDPATWPRWLGYDALASAERLTAASLFVTSPAMALPAGAAAYLERSGRPMVQVRPQARSAQRLESSHPTNGGSHGLATQGGDALGPDGPAVATHPVHVLEMADVSQFDFYDRADVVAMASDAVAEHFGLASDPALEPDVLRTIARFFAAIDATAWTTARQYMAPSIEIDYSSLSGQPGATVPSDAVLDGWAQLLPGFDATHHHLGLLDVVASGTRAFVRTTVVGDHILGQENWRVGGRYRMGLNQVDGRWQLSELTFELVYQEGRLDLPNAARERVSS